MKNKYPHRRYLAVFSDGDTYWFPNKKAALSYINVQLKLHKRDKEKITVTLKVETILSSFKNY